MSRTLLIACLAILPATTLAAPPERATSRQERVSAADLIAAGFERDGSSFRHPGIPFSRLSALFGFRYGDLEWELKGNGIRAYAHAPLKYGGMRICFFAPRGDDVVEVCFWFYE